MAPFCSKTFHHTMVTLMRSHTEGHEPNAIAMIDTRSVLQEGVDNEMMILS